MLYRMLIIDWYSYLYSYSSNSTRTRTHVKIKYSDSYSYSHILQVLVPVLVLVNLVLAPALISVLRYSKRPHDFATKIKAKFHKIPGPRLNIKKVFSNLEISIMKIRLSYFYIGNIYAGKIASSYWDGTQVDQEPAQLVNAWKLLISGEHQFHRHICNARNWIISLKYSIYRYRICPNYVPTYFSGSVKCVAPSRMKRISCKLQNILMG